MKPSLCLSPKSQKKGEDEEEKEVFFFSSGSHEDLINIQGDEDDGVPFPPRLLCSSSLADQSARPVSCHKLAGPRVSSENENWGVREDLSLQNRLLPGPDDEHLAGGTSSTKAPESQLL